MIEDSLLCSWKGKGLFLEGSSSFYNDVSCYALRLYIVSVFVVHCLYFVLFHSLLYDFFKLVIYSHFSCDVLSRLSLFSVWEWYIVDRLNLSRHT